MKAFRIFSIIFIVLALMLILVLPATAQAPTSTETPTVTNFWSSFLEQLTLAFLPPLAAAAVGFLIFQIKLLMAKIKAEKPDVYEQMLWVVRTAVQAAEQAGIGKVGAEKKQYALDFVQSWLAEKNLKINLSLIDKAIEAAVYEEINKPGLIATKELKAG